MKSVLIAAAIAVLGVGPVAHGNTRAPACADLNWPDLQPSDPGFADATDFARTLADRGVVVQCMAASTMNDTFEGQVGAVVYRTSHGTFDALFLPAAQDFAALEIHERDERGRYIYSFSGHPAPWPANRIDSAEPVYFVKYRNRLLVVHEETVAARLESAFAR